MVNWEGDNEAPTSGSVLKWAVICAIAWFAAIAAAWTVW